MCAFLSICVRKDGSIAHVPANSHSAAVEHYGWRENDQTADFRGAFFVEAEWNCEGAFPGAEKISRGALNEKQRKVITTFYTNAAKLLADPAEHAERMCLGRGYFAAEQYADIRFRVLLRPKCPPAVADKIALTRLHTGDIAIAAVHPAVQRLEGALVVAPGATLTAPALAEVGDFVSLSTGATLTAPALAEVGSDVFLYEGATLTAPALAEVGGDVFLYEGATLTAPALLRN